MMKIKKVLHYRLDIIFKNARGWAKSIQNMWIVVNFLFTIKWFKHSNKKYILIGGTFYELKWLLTIFISKIGNFNYNMHLQDRKFNVTSILWVYLQVPCDCHIAWPINTWNRSTSICTFHSSYFCPVMVKLKIVCLYVNVMFLNDKTNELFIGCLNLQCCE